MININPIFYVIVGILTTVIAQISLKRGGGLEPFKLNWFFIISLSIFFYILSFLSYYFALRKFEISKIQPIMMVMIVMLIAIYGFLAGERFNYVKLSGIILAALSVFLILKA